MHCFGVLAIIDLLVLKWLCNKNLGQELMVSALAQADALVKLLIEKGLITEAEFMEKLKGERATYQGMLLKLGAN